MYTLKYNRPLILILNIQSHKSHLSEILSLGLNVRINSSLFKRHIDEAHWWTLHHLLSPENQPTNQRAPKLKKTIQLDSLYRLRDGYYALLSDRQGGPNIICSLFAPRGGQAGISTAHRGSPKRRPLSKIRKW